MTERADQSLVFAGEDSILQFLNPGNHLTPIVELPPHLNPYLREDVHIFAKRMDMTPLGNIKSVPAFNMVSTAWHDGRLDGVSNLVENSSGNTVLSLAVIGRAFGIGSTLALVSDEVAFGKLSLLRLFGTNIQINREPICPDYGDPTSGIYKARELGEQITWFNPGQYDNLANPEAHERYTGPQIWEQTDGDVSVFCAGLGTTGTLLGVGNYLRTRSENITTVGVARAANNPVPGVRTLNLLKEVSFSWKEVADYIELAGTTDSYEASLRLIRSGIVVGPSSGFSLVGLNRFIERQIEQKNLDRFRNRKGQVLAVFICCDTPYPYLDDYFSYLDPSAFPEIGNEELLKHKDGKRISYQGEHLISEVGNFEVDPKDAFQAIYPQSPEEVREDLKEGTEIIINQDVAILDLSTDFEFLDHHIPGAQNIRYEDLFEAAKIISARGDKRGQKQKVFITCPGGGTSKNAVIGLSGGFSGIEPLSIRGGMIEWSRLDLPRSTPTICRKN